MPATSPSAPSSGPPGSTSDPGARPERPTSPPEIDLDAIVIGAGSGGLTCAVGLSRFGKEVLLLEAADIGGDCTNVGCIPSKSLLHESARCAAAAGDPGDVLETVRRRRNRLRDHEEVEFGGLDGVHLRYGRAELVDASTVAVFPHPNPAGRQPPVYVVSARNVVIATGSAPMRPAIPGLPEDRYLTNDDLFEQSEPPRHLAIVGAGPAGIEMAMAFRHLGSEVTLVEAAQQVLPRILPEAAAIVTDELTSRGVRLRTGFVARHYDARTSTLHLGPTTGPGTGAGTETGTEAVSGVDRVLVAVGRRPNSDGLGLEAVGVAVDEDGHVEIDHRGRTNVRGVWAVGDVTNRGGTTHAANAWGRRIISGIVARPLPAGPEPVLADVVFTTPEVATVGTQPTEPPNDVHRITVPVGGADDGLGGIDRAFTDRVDAGLLVVDVARFTGRVRGATIVAPRAGELILPFSLAIKTGTGFHRWYGHVAPYPTYGDALTNAVDEYLLRSLPRLHEELGAWLGSLAGRARARTR